VISLKDGSNGSVMEGSGIKLDVEELRGNPVEPAALDE